MSIAQLFFKKENKINNITLDIIVQESATTSSRVTSNPVENGADMNDHIIIDPMTFSTEGVVSNISSSTVGQFLRVPSVLTQSNTKAQEAWEALRLLQTDRVPFTLVQGLAVYENIVILTLSQNTNKDTANGLFFTANYQEIIKVGAEVQTAANFNDTDTADGMIDTVIGGLKNLAGI